MTEKFGEKIKEIGLTEIDFLLQGVVLKVDEVDNVWMVEVSQNFQLLNVMNIHSFFEYIYLYFFHVGISIWYPP